jgi:YesN/AraC family two-component response regulator
MNRAIRLLIVDDETQILATYSSFFKKRDFQVETATDGKSGLALLIKGEFDVAIVDIQMPQMNGIELAEKVNTEGIDTSLIILTGHGDKENAIRAINASVGGWFEKASVKMDDLLKKVTELAEVIPIHEIRKILSVIPNTEIEVKKE